MRPYPLLYSVRRWLTLTALCAATGLVQAQPAILWEAFNDHRPAAGTTNPNASTWDIRKKGDGGVLKNIAHRRRVDGRRACHG